MLYFLYYDRMIRTTAELVRQAADPVVHRTAVAVPVVRRTAVAVPAVHRTAVPVVRQTAVPVVRQTAVAVHMAEQVSGMHMTEPADG